MTGCKNEDYERITVHATRPQELPSQNHRPCKGSIQSYYRHANLLASRVLLFTFFEGTFLSDYLNCIWEGATYIRKRKEAPPVLFWRTCFVRRNGPWPGRKSELPKTHSCSAGNTSVLYTYSLFAPCFLSLFVPFLTIMHIQVHLLFTCGIWPRDSIRRS